ncbi:MAG: O-methyltransferase [Saprospiraceae bacterium]
MIETDELYEYCEQHSTLPHAILPKMERQAYLRTTQAHMISGSLQGALLTLLVKISGAKQILDIGTFTGYSAICLAAGLTEGKVHSIDIDEEKADWVNNTIHEAGLSEKISTYIGKALEIIPTIDGDFDLAYLDADKESYADYFELLMPRMKTGGLIVTDNVLWKGKVLSKHKDKKTEIISAFNKKIQNDERVENLLLPIRDGLMLIRKK